MVALQDGASGAKTLLYHIHVDRGISWDMATAMLADDQLPPPTSAPQVRCPAARPHPGATNILKSGAYPDPTHEHSEEPAKLRKPKPRRQARPSDSCDGCFAG